MKLDPPEVESWCNVDWQAELCSCCSIRQCAKRNMLGTFKPLGKATALPFFSLGSVWPHSSQIRNVNPSALVGTRMHVFPEARTRSTLAGAPQWRARYQCAIAITSSCNHALRIRSLCNLTISGKFVKFSCHFCYTTPYMQLKTGWGTASGTPLGSLWTRINYPLIEFSQKNFATRFRVTNSWNQSIDHAWKNQTWHEVQE